MDNVAEISRRFATVESDSETSLYYYRARYYNPQLQRFISEDPIGFSSGDVNLYGYANNSPIDFTDPNGLTEYPNNFVGPLPRNGIPHQRDDDDFLRKNSAASTDAEC